MNNKGLNLSVIFILCAAVAFTGCGNTKVSKAELKRLGLINSFEKTASEISIGDFSVETGGYVNLEQFKKHSTNGKFSAKAVFSVPKDFLSENEIKKISEWNAGITININTLSKLKVTDWSPYKKFAIDVFSDNDKEYTMFLKLHDAQGKEYLASMPVKKGKNKLEFMLDAVKAARIDITSIVSFTVYLNTKDEPSDVTLYLDNIRLVP